MGLDLDKLLRDDVRTTLEKGGACGEHRRTTVACVKPQLLSSSTSPSVLAGCGVCELGERGRVRWRRGRIGTGA